MRSQQGDRRFGWPIVTLVVLFVLLILALLGPRLIALYWLSWGTDFFKRILYEDLGLSEAWSSSFAVVLSFGYALALAYLFGWSLWRVFSWRASAKQVSITFVSYLIVFALPHVIHGVADTWTNPGVCFNQRTGEPIKWYVTLTGGQVVLYDSAGFDKFGIKKLPVTQEICEIFDQQQSGRFPKAIIADPREVQFFSPTTGAPLVWYSRAADGSINLFGGKGFDPATSALLQAVTPEVVVELKADAEKKVAETAAAKALADKQATQAAADQPPRPPQQITTDAHRIIFFNPITGAPQVWYSKNADGNFAFFDGTGYDPGTGERLLPVTPEVAAKAREIASAKKVGAAADSAAAADQSRVNDTAGTAAAAPLPLQPSVETAVPPSRGLKSPTNAANVSGAWRGRYQYFDGRSPVEFSMTFSGETACNGRSSERNTFGGGAPTLYANLSCDDGILSPGSAITIAKRYDGTGGYSQEVIYTGTVAADLKSIEGTWAINGQTGGSFTLWR